MVIKITSTPPGKSPEKVREMWVGVVISGVFRASLDTPPPLSLDEMLQRPLPTPYYGIATKELMEQLHEQKPELRAWYDQNQPELLVQNKRMFIEATCAEVIGEAPE